MPKSVPYKEILNAALDGVDNAFKKYYKWSYSPWLGEVPESFIEAEIANSLSKIVPYITLQDTISSTLEDAGADLRGPKPRNSALGRVDIIVWWKDETPRILIEVKRAWRDYSLNSDARRLRQLINKDSTIQKGLLVACTSAQKPETIENRFKNMADESGTILQRRLGLKKRRRDGEISYWDAGCFSVNP